VFSALLDWRAISSVEVTVPRGKPNKYLKAVSDGSKEGVSWIGSLDRDHGGPGRRAGGVHAGRIGGYVVRF
jgi:hypothetical protein